MQSGEKPGSMFEDNIVVYFFGPLLDLSRQKIRKLLQYFLSRNIFSKARYKRTKNAIFFPSTPKLLCFFFVQEMHQFLFIQFVFINDHQNILDYQL
jgi:hypothetical protein